MGLERGHRVWPHVMPPVLALFAIVVQPYALDVIIPLLFCAYGAAFFTASHVGLTCCRACGLKVATPLVAFGGGLALR